MLKTITEALQKSPQLIEPVSEMTAMALRYLSLYQEHQRRFYDVDEFGCDPSVIDMVRPFFEFLYDTYWRVEAHGVHHVRNKGRVLLVSNHSGSLPYDASMIHMAIYRNHPQKRQARFLVEDLVQYIPFIGTFITRCGGVRASRENAERLLASEQPLIVFPEGVKGLGKLYRNRYKLARFGRGGIIHLAVKTRTPIVPCAVIGAEEIHPILWKGKPLARLFGLPYIPFTPTFPLMGPLGLVPLPSKWVVLFGKPIRYDQMPLDLLDDPVAVHAETERLRSTIQDMIHKGLGIRAEQ